MLTYRDVRMKVRLTAGVISAIVAIGGGVTALASYSDYAPATRGYVKEVARDQVKDALGQITATQQGMNFKFDRLQAQFNKSNIASLRSEKSNRELMKIGAPDEATRQFFQRQIDEIDDQIREALRDRDRISLP